MSETRPSAERMTQEQLAATRQFVHDHPGACLDGAMMLAELDAVTRERNKHAADWIAQTEELGRVTRERDEAIERAERCEAYYNALTSLREQP